MRPIIQPCDRFRVTFHGSSFTLCRRAKVVHEPQATGDSWVFEDVDTGDIHYVSEGFTMTKLPLAQAGR